LSFSITTNKVAESFTDYTNGENQLQWMLIFLPYIKLNLICCYLEKGIKEQDITVVDT
jgi:hypothetical protein